MRYDPDHVSGEFLIVSLRWDVAVLP